MKKIVATRRLAAGLAILAWLSAPRPAAATPEVLYLGGHSLVAASCGLRQTFWIEHYAIILYLPENRLAAEAMGNPAIAKAVRLNLIDKRGMPPDIPRRWREPLERHLDAATLAEAQRAYQQLRPGDQVTLAYTPGAGVVLLVNQTALPLTGGHRLIDDVLLAWANGQSVEDKLHRVVARHPCQPTAAEAPLDPPSL